MKKKSNKTLVYGDVVRLWLKGKKYREISSSLGVSISTIHSAISGMRKKGVLLPYRRKVRQYDRLVKLAKKQAR